MTADTLRSLQALRGLTRPGPAHAVIAQVQSDLQTVIEAVLELAGHDDESVTEEPAVGEQVTDSIDVVWQRFEDGWHWWMEGADGWSTGLRAWVDVQNSGPLRPTTDDDRRHVRLPVRDENTPPAAQEARGADSGTGGPPEPENGAQGRIGWIRLKPGDERRLLTREVPGGWTDTDLADDDLVWTAENWPNAEFTPIRTLADDEVAVKRGVLDNAAARLRGVVTVMEPSEVAIAHEAADTLTQAKFVSDALGADR